MNAQDLLVAYGELDRVGVGISRENPDGVILYTLDVPSAVYMTSECVGGVYSPPRLLPLLKTCTDRAAFWDHVAPALIALEDASPKK